MRRPLPPSLLVLLLVASATGCSTAPKQDTAQCVQDQHCPGDQVCRAGTCGPPGCGDGGPCAVGQACVGGACRGGGAGECGEATVLTDCGANFRCVERTCVAFQCAPGTIAGCSDPACGEGTHRCRDNGAWGPCSASPQIEICGDAVDNDCDGAVDEGCAGCQAGDERPCTTECGDGVERCVGTEWRGCSAERPRDEQCGNGVDDDCDGTIDEGCDDCEEGSTRPCATDCGAGTERCLENTWRECDAPLPSPEVCDGQDNDCDELVDEELVRDCGTQCGPGTETCQAGQWAGCTAPLDCGCGDGDADDQICGQCGVRQRTCAGGRWGAFSACSEGDVECHPGEVTEERCGRCGTNRRVCTSACRFGEPQGCKGEGQCAPDASETSACPGGCGQHSRSCTAQCTWGEYGACDVGGAEGCAPGDEQTRACERCGEQRRVCTAACAWGEWSACAGAGVCEPGEEQGQPCGNCAAQLRTCDAQCQWGGWGACEGGGQCVQGDEERRDCGRCGDQTRVCDVTCIWSAWQACGGEGPCAPGDSERRDCGESEVGECRLGVQVRTCGNACQWSDYDACRGNVDPQEEICGDRLDQDCDGVNDRRPDRYEPNNSCEDCYVVPETDPNVFLNATLDALDADEEDFYCFDTDDATNLPGFSEHILVDLEDIPNGVDYDLYLYRSVADCAAHNSTASSTAFGSADEHLDYVEGFGDDGGRWVVRVRRASGYDCNRTYRLTINGLD